VTGGATRPTFGELTIRVRGATRIEIGDDAGVVILEAGHAIWIEPDVRVRYSNPGPGEGEYFAVCIPAFTAERANREPE
jgi:hypothetical protein